MAEKVTEMLLNVDLQCSCCYKKIKKLLCKFPQIRDQVYDDKQNQVIITVVCCSPEKIRDKLCCKGGKVIKSIDIKEPQKPKPDQSPGKAKPPETNPENSKKKEKPDNPHPCQPIRVEVQYRYPPYPGRGCCGPCSEGYPGGPCYHGHEMPTLPPTPLPQPFCEGYWYAGGKRCHVSRCDYYFSEENFQGCTII
ncbi:hypothetical protein LguiA_015209 [Lonicera macranthoides]